MNVECPTDISSGLKYVSFMLTHTLNMLFDIQSEDVVKEYAFFPLQKSDNLSEN